MAPYVRKLIAGNWKMNGLQASLGQALAVAEALALKPCPERVAICPPATLIAPMVQALEGSDVQVGGQNCYVAQAGAFTGEISAEMLMDAGAQLVILAHSERRQLFGETDESAAEKARAALRAGLEPIICVGETLEERRAGRTLDVVSRQVRGSCPAELAGCVFSVAYEPVWAIGSGLTPTLEEVEQVHGAIRGLLSESFGESGRIAPILYGGSVKPSNAREFLSAREVGGALVGGASLLAEEFLGIIRAAS